MASTTGHSELPSPAGGLKGEVTLREPTRTEQTIARRSAEARATVPDLELSAVLDATAAEEFAPGGGPSFTAVLVRAYALALGAHPLANAAYRDGHYELYSRVNVGVTLPTEEAFVVPTILDADTKTLEQVRTELEMLTARAASGDLTPPDFAGATSALTDLGAYGVAQANTLLAPPHATSLAAGAIRSTPVVRNGEVVPGRTVMLTLACDSRILFGTRAAAFLASVVEVLERARV